MDSIVPSYSVILRDWNFRTVAIFDVFKELSYTKELNGIGSYSLGINSLDPRVDLFQLDYLVDIRRSVPGCGISRYSEFIGFHRKPAFSIENTGEQKFISSGVGLNFLLQGATVNYPAATIRSYKWCSSNRAILEYVYENCGPIATVADERFSEAVLPNFEVSDIIDYGEVWEGDRAFENLFDVLTDLAKYSGIDFNIRYVEEDSVMRFETFVDGFGLNRTDVGLDSTTGLNSFGQSPLIFSVERGNVASLSYDYNRLSEGNMISVLGDGDGATRHIETREFPSRYDSPYNRREISRPYNGFINEMQVFGDEALNESRAKETVSIEPLLQPSCMYGKHYFLGDWIAVVFRGRKLYRKIISIKNQVGPAEKIQIGFLET